MKHNYRAALLVMIASVTICVLPGRVAAQPPGEDLGATIMEVLERFALQDNVKVDRASRKGARTSVRALFLRKEGYLMRDLMRVLSAIEAAHPQVRVASFDFGRRDKSRDIWRPAGRALVVDTDPAFNQKIRQETSALTRARNFMSSIEKLRKEVGEVEIDRLNVRGDEIRWDMRLRQVRGWNKAQRMFLDLPGVSGAERGMTQYSEEGLYLFRQNRLILSSPQTVSNPQREAMDLETRIQEVFQRHAIQDKVIVEAPRAQQRQGLQATVTTVLFKEKEGYRLGDLLRVLETIRKAVPGAAILSIDLGANRDASGQEVWLPRSLEIGTPDRSRESKEAERQHAELRSLDTNELSRLRATVREAVADCGAFRFRGFKATPRRIDMHFASANLSSLGALLESLRKLPRFEAFCLEEFTPRQGATRAYECKAYLRLK